MYTYTSASVCCHTLLAGASVEDAPIHYNTSVMCGRTVGCQVVTRSSSFSICAPSTRTIGPFSTAFSFQQSGIG